MGSQGSPKTWIPYMNTKDCSQGFCSLYCPQWCYMMIPPPPASEFPEDNSSSSLNFSPLVIAIIGILVSAFLLVSYYTIISKYCGNEDRRRAGRENHDQNEELEDIHNLSIHEPWHVVTAGLDEALIKSLTVCTYKKGDGLVEGTDCSVCLSEFEEDESLRLLPKCNHAFHLPCIDTWLISHSNCPLCRANIVAINPSQLPHHAVTENSLLTNHDASSLAESQAANDQNVVMAQNSERGSSQNVELMQGDHHHAIPKTLSIRALSDLGNAEERDHSTIIEIGGDYNEGYHQTIRRSVSMDDSRPNRVLVSDILRMNDEEEAEEEDNINIHDYVGGCLDSEFDDNAAGSSSKQSAGGVGKCSHRKGALLNCVMSPVAMKRSFSSGRFFQTRPSRAQHTVIPA